ncbi:hypothetical protein DDZ13_11505 [Coraliomargarita sinensis]|uniref:Uncharacterized protein n=1 Tax=Coraliomargarita sinensis TaxID=2174842 RepID=A0A317ZIK6_9BACT|nr:hypothetical protein DDZ13_11505 [Coraliomargarita sinensis]
MGGLLVPAHLRTVDAVAVDAAGEAGPSNGAKISESLNAAHTGPARILAEATGNTERFTPEIQRLNGRQPAISLIGGPDSSFEAFIDLLPQDRLSEEAFNPVISLLLPRNQRLTLVERLSNSSNANIAALLNIRELEGMVKLHPASHPAGAPYDAGLLTIAQLIESDHIDPEWADQIGGLANQAAIGESDAISAVEALIMATLSLGRQLDFRSVANLAEFNESLQGWADMATLFRARPEEIPLLYAILHYQEASQPLFDYLSQNPESGLQDVRLALNDGPGAVDYLLREALPVHQPTTLSQQILKPLEPYRPPFFTQLSITSRSSALWLKLGLFLAAGLAFSLAMGAAWRGSSKASREVGYFTPPILARDICLSLVFTLTLWFTFEPDILKSTSDEVDSAPRIEFAVAGAIESIKSPVKAMQELNQVTLLVLLLFFVVQLVIYCFCLIKLKEISKQMLNPKMKLQLLDNEENLFDFGLYVGLGGTVLSLILVAVGIVEASLMAAYASTLFGILFVALLKVMHLRPFRRQLILEAGRLGGEDDSGGLMKNIKL